MTKIYSILQLKQTCRDKPTTWRILLRTIIFDFHDLASCFAIDSSPHSSLKYTDMEKLVEKNPVTKFYSILQLKILIFKTCVETYILLGEFSEDFYSNVSRYCTYQHCRILAPFQLISIITISKMFQAVL